MFNRLSKPDTRFTMLLVDRTNPLFHRTVRSKNAKMNEKAVLTVTED